MAAPTMKDLSAATAQGDLEAVTDLIQEGAEVNKKSKDGMTPLSIAAFWGYIDIAKVLLKYGANINAQNSGTMWTPLHCACFQGHGPIIMKLMEQQPDLTIKDQRGRTPVDFASALDSVWSFFGAAGCKRTPKSKLIEMDIVYKIALEDTSLQSGDMAYFSRPGSAYAFCSDIPAKARNLDMELAAITGDVLGSSKDETSNYHEKNPNPSFSIYQN